MYNGPKYNKNNFFIYSNRIGHTNRLVFLIEDVFWSKACDCWMYTVYYPYEKLFRRYTENKIDTECSIIEDELKKQKMMKALFGYKKGA